ncbi:MAG: DHHA1 domain-containing protein [Candidatus Berkelbacteria bacterium]|nr:DHHA1 domain-containing protein [Candidatus Berkelbacteria bacterium]
MDLTPKQQATQAIKEAQKILLIAHEELDGDAIGSLLALNYILSKIGKEVLTISSGSIPAVYSFLSDIDSIKKDMDGIKDFMIFLSEEHAKVARLSYKLEDNRLKIVISPKAGNFSPNDVNFAYGDFHYDLIIILDADALERLGTIYRENTEMFYKTDTLNIDHHVSNTYFGKINWVDESASSVCEILVSLIEALESEQGKLMNGNAATALLLGIMTDTNLFQNPATTSKSLTVAAQLIALGGDRDLIAKRVFQTHSYSTLKIWGKILSKLDSYPALGLVWSEVTKSDLDITGADEGALSQAVNNLLYTTEGAKIVALFSESNGMIKVSLRSTGGFDVAAIARDFGGGGHEKAAGFKMDGLELEEAKRIVLKKLRGIILGEQTSLETKEENRTQIEERKNESIPAKIPES